MADLISDSLFVELDSGDRLHLRRFHQSDDGVPAFMLHGSLENGRIFYSRTGKGLGPFLARRGFDVFVGDLRGRGESQPLISRRSRFGQTEAITEDITAFIARIREIKGDQKQHWIAHSWGGVLMFAHLARFDKQTDVVRSLVCFATKRCIRVRNFDKVIKIDLLWKFVGRVATRLFGYLPTHLVLKGADVETVRSHSDNITWITPGPWIDPKDGFDYGTAIQSTPIPETLWMVGAADKYLGNPKDVRDFMLEVGLNPDELMILSTVNGALHDYGHIDIMTHPDASRDHFPKVADWLDRH